MGRAVSGKGPPPHVQLALGRIFRLLSRPALPGDVEKYEEARRVALSGVPLDVALGYAPSWVRDRNKGAAGD